MIDRGYITARAGRPRGDGVVCPRMLVKQLGRSTCQDGTSVDRDNLAKSLMICTQRPCRNASNDKGRDRAREQAREYAKLSAELWWTAVAMLSSAAWHRTASCGIEEWDVADDEIVAER